MNLILYQLLIIILLSELYFLERKWILFFVFCVDQLVLIYCWYALFLNFAFVSQNKTFWNKVCEACKMYVFVVVDWAQSSVWLLFLIPVNTCNLLKCERKWVLHSPWRRKCQYFTQCLSHLGIYRNFARCTKKNLSHHCSVQPTERNRTNEVCSPVWQRWKHGGGWKESVQESEFHYSFNIIPELCEEHTALKFNLWLKYIEGGKSIERKST